MQAMNLFALSKIDDRGRSAMAALRVILVVH
jgi:hypothetical protein